jgi:hypothetical protein
MFAKTNVISESLEESYLDNFENKLLSAVLTKKVLALRNRDLNRNGSVA